MALDGSGERAEVSLPEVLEGLFMTNSNESADPARRRGEAPAHHFRSERFWVVNGVWFFSTREGIDVGSYSDREAAEAAAATLSEMLDGINDREITKQFVREPATTRRCRRHYKAQRCSDDGRTSVTARLRGRISQ